MGNTRLIISPSPRVISLTVKISVRSCIVVYRDNSRRGFGFCPYLSW